MSTGLAGAVLLYAPNAQACEPCPTVEPFDAAAEKAQVVVVAQVPDGLVPDYKGDPPTIKLQVTRVLKGELEDRLIAVHAFSGMCAYGFTPRTADPHVLAMVKRPTGDWGLPGNGCFESMLPVVDGKLPDGELFDAFVSRLFPDAKAAVKPDPAPAPNSDPKPDPKADLGATSDAKPPDPKKSAAPVPKTGASCSVAGPAAPGGSLVLLGLLVWIRRRR